MTRWRWRATVTAVGVGLAGITTPAHLASQSPNRTLAQGDSAWNAGDLDRARALYGKVVEADSTNSRLIFRMAQLETNATRALVLYRRYIALEPDDPWGHMAEGDHLGRMGRWDDALVAYAGASAIAPGERDVAIGRARLLALAGRPHDAAGELESWLIEHPADGEAWDLLGRSRMRAGDGPHAAEAFDRAAQLGVRGASGRARAARASSSPVLTPEWSSSGDSDGIRSTAIGGSIDVMVGTQVRAGALARRVEVRNDVDQLRGLDLRARMSLAPAPGVHLTTEAGAVLYGTSTASPESWMVPQVSVRLRARAPAGGASIDLRADHAPSGYSPELVANRVERSEARVTMELPAGAMRVRGSARIGQFTSPDEAAVRRGGLEGALVFPLGGGRWQPSLHYRVIGHDRAATAGFFAPRRATTAEAGFYSDLAGEGPLSLAVDVGAGAQRIEAHGSVPGSWTPAWRLWAQASVALAPSRSFFMEAEAYDAAFSPAGAAGASGSWRFLSVATGVRWGGF